jgi:hypothetical protein
LSEEIAWRMETITKEQLMKLEKLKRKGGWPVLKSIAG